MAEQSSATGGIGFLGLLAIVFIVLKLTAMIDWSWFWVLAPIWMPAAFLLIVVALVVTGSVAAWAWKRVAKS